MERGIGENFKPTRIRTTEVRKMRPLDHQSSFHRYDAIYKFITQKQLRSSFKKKTRDWRTDQLTEWRTDGHNLLQRCIVVYCIVASKKGNKRRVKEQGKEKERREEKKKRKPGDAVSRQKDFFNWRRKWIFFLFSSFFLPFFFFSLFFGRGWT